MRYTNSQNLKFYSKGALDIVLSSDVALADNVLKSLTQLSGGGGGG
jgi:hypothetical protein